MNIDNTVDHSSFVFHNVGPQWLMILAVIWLLMSIVMTDAGRRRKKE